MISTRLRDPRGLARLFSPQSIAIVGASATPTSFGARFMTNLAGFTGRLYLVNPRYDKIGAQPCYNSLDELPETPDCVIVATGLATVEAIFEKCIAAGAGGVILIASGFSETGSADSAGDHRGAGMAHRRTDIARGRTAYLAPASAPRDRDTAAQVGCAGHGAGV